MLKVDYTETGLYLETVTIGPEELIAQRVLLALRLGYPLYMKQSTASVLLTGEESLICRLERALDNEDVSFSLAEAQKLELIMVGLWISEDVDSAKGTLITTLNDEAESLIKELCVAA